MVDTGSAVEVRSTERFEAWFEDLYDPRARLRIQVRIDRLASGNPGLHRVLPGGVRELKIDYGPGYRVYYTRRNRELILLLCGGNKGSQQHDIDTAVALAADLE
jgi:putative addiction module killer protein